MPGLKPFGMMNLKNHFLKKYDGLPDEWNMLLEY